MSDKNNIKDKLKERFDMQKNYNQIINKIEAVDDIKKRSWFKYSLIPICVLFVIGFMVFNNINNYRTFKTATGNKIVINKLNEVGATSLDADVRLNVDVKVQEEFSEYGFVNDIDIPSDLHLSSQYLLYTKKHCETKEECINTPYDILHDYVIDYESRPTSRWLIEKNITIAFSKDFTPLRDYYIDHKPLKISNINGIELEIANYNEMYIATFSYRKLNFDIETKGITESEFIKLLESLLS